ncbi:MAG: hypothetical protein V4662_05125 [Verrucomicrobiota bacterium]
MKSTLLLTLLSSAALLQAQTPTPTAAPTSPEKPKLTEAQVSNVLTQLKELEKTILTQRGSTLSSILAKLNEAIASDGAAIKFFTDCDVLVNSERKEASKAEARQRAEMVERNMERKSKAGASADDEEGDTALALRLGLRYLMLTLEAHEAKDEDFKKMVPKLQAYVADLVASAPKLKGRAMTTLNRVCGGNSPVIQAFELDRYLARPHWSRNPADFGGMYGQTLLFVAKTESPESLGPLWDSRINNEAAFRKEQMAQPEYELWLKNELPALRWDRATFLYQDGPSPVAGMADMLKVIKDYPWHADAPAWVQQLRTSVNDSSATPATTDPSSSNTPPPSTADTN